MIEINTDRRSSAAAMRPSEPQKDEAVSQPKSSTERVSEVQIDVQPVAELALKLESGEGDRKVVCGLKQEGVKLSDSIKLNSVGQASLRVQLRWEHVNVVPKDQRLQKQPRKILDDICGSVRPREFLAIMGASGAGKTTLLNYLSNKMFPADLHADGLASINGIRREKIDYFKFTAFVQQDDVLSEMLTVKEVLEFTAALKCSPDPRVRAEKVQEMLTELELVQIQNQRIGGPNDAKTLSRGEKKRLSIAIELITNPALVFMDEPTTSMDTFTAEKIIEIINKLKLKGRTIIATIHQPNTEIYRNLDQLMLLSHGHVIYLGKASDAVQYFDGIGHPCPVDKNPAEFFMTTMSQEGAAHFVSSYDRSPMAGRYLEDASGLTDFAGKDISTLKYAASWNEQLGILCRRSLMAYTRNKIAMSRRYFIIVYVAIVAMIFYYQLGTSTREALQSRTGLLYFCANGAIMNAMQMSILIFPEERAVFMREQASSLYDVLPYFLSRVLIDVPFGLGDGLVFSLIGYWTYGLSTTDASKFFIFMFGLMMATTASSAYSFFLGTIITDREVLITLVPIINIPLGLLSGWFVRLDGSVTVLWPFQWISSFKYAFNLLLRNELTNNANVHVYGTSTHFDSATNRTVSVPVVYNSEQLLDTMEAKLEVWECFVGLLALFLVFTTFAYIGLKVTSRRV